MEIPNYDVLFKNKKNFKQVEGCEFMPNDIFRMLICGSSGCGKTNTLFHMLIEPLLYYDEIHLYAKNLEQEKYQNLINIMNDMSRKNGYNYDIMTASNYEIIPIESLPYEDKQKIIIFDDYVCEKNQREIVDYFIQGRHKNCSVIYLSQSFYKTPKDIRLNCSHYCIFGVTTRERNMLSSELGVEKEQFKKATKKQYDFLYVDKPRKKVKKNFNGKI